MNIEELKTNLDYLATKYVTDSAKLSELKSRIQKIEPKKFPPAKGIIMDMGIYLSSVPDDSKDAEVIRDISFYFL